MESFTSLENILHLNRLPSKVKVIFQRKLLYNNKFCRTIQLNHYHIVYFKTVRKVDAKHYSVKSRDIQKEVLVIVVVVSAVLHMHKS